MPGIAETDLILNNDGSVYHLNLLPHHLSDTIITVGDPERVQRVSQHFDVVEDKIHRREFITHVGTFHGKRVTVISSGIGTDNVEILLTELDALANIDLETREPKVEKRRLKIIRIGTSGALREDIPLGTHLVSDYAAGLDNLMHFYALDSDELERRIALNIQQKIKLPFLPYVVRGSALLRNQIGFDMMKGNTVTTPGFYAPQGRMLRLVNRYPTLLDDFNTYCERESGLIFTNFEMETAAYYAFGRLLDHEILSVNAIVANRIRKTFAKDSHAIIDRLIAVVLNRI